MRKRTKRVWQILIGLTLLTIFLIISANTCISSYLRWGLAARSCPDGTPVLGVRVNAHNLVRGGSGMINVSAVASYTTGPAYESQSALLSRFDAEVELLRDGKPIEFQTLDVKDRGKVISHKVQLPADLPDGNYVLRAKVDSSLGEDTYDLKLGLFAPARVHVLTDRPLYEPGNEILFRAVFLRARDLVPLAGRPVTFTLVDPTGLDVFSERIVTDDWGVAASSVPLDTRAPSGRWTVRATSGEDSGQATVRVEPFTLPRFSVTADFGKPYFEPSDKPVLRGTVRFASGAPVAGARLDIDWRTQGASIPSINWQTLPPRTVTGRDGSFRLELPRIPPRFIGRATVIANIAATDETGDRINGRASMLISRDGLSAQVETEMNGGLAQGFNNRMYVRVTTPEGRPLPNTKVTVRRAWDDSHEPVLTTTDESAVAALQIDPGPPVNIIIEESPPLPPPPPEPVVRLEARDVLRSNEATLADQLVLDRVEPSFSPCTRFVPDGSGEMSLHVLIEPGGRVVRTEPGGHRGAECIAGKLSSARFSAGRLRHLFLRYTLTENEPDIQIEYGRAPSSALQEVLQGAMLGARNCVGRGGVSRYLPQLLSWHTTNEGRGFKLDWYPENGQGRLATAAESACIKKALNKVARTGAEKLYTANSFGTARVRVVPVGGESSQERLTRTRIGYELEVLAQLEQREVKTKVFLPPAKVPQLRLRLSSSLPAPGETLEFEFLRGPKFRGDLPRFIYARNGRSTKKIKLEKGQRKGTFEIPKDAAGWWVMDSGAAVSRFFVRDDRRLSLKVEAGKELYRPGEKATLRLTTKVGDKPTAAAVALVGVDQSLGQLATLVGPDAYEGLAPQVPTRGPAFVTLEARALAAGQIAGDNAAAAIVLRVSDLPTLAELDRRVSAQGQTHFDPGVAVSRGFYTVLEDLYGRVRRWEKETPKDETMTAKTMARLFKESAEATGKGDAPRDAYGRPLSLGILPDELLALVDPRMMVADGTRLPEDVENWTVWVEENAR